MVDLRESLRMRRDQLVSARERAGASRSTALCQSEQAVIDKGSWMHEVKVADFVVVVAAAAAAAVV